MKRKRPINTMTLPENDFANSPGTAYPQTQSGGPRLASPTHASLAFPLRDMYSTAIHPIDWRTNAPGRPPTRSSLFCFCAAASFLILYYSSRHSHAQFTLRREVADETLLPSTKIVVVVERAYRRQKHLSLSSARETLLPINRHL